MYPRYEVKRKLGNKYINCWIGENGKLQTFATPECARTALVTYIEELKDAGEKISLNEFIIQPSELTND